MPRPAGAREPSGRSLSQGYSVSRWTGELCSAGHADRPWWPWQDSPYRLGPEGQSRPRTGDLFLPPGYQVRDAGCSGGSAEGVQPAHGPEDFQVMGAADCKGLGGLSF